MATSQRSFNVPSPQKYLKLSPLRENSIKRLMAMLTKIDSVRDIRPSSALCRVEYRVALPNTRWRRMTFSG
jgi:hypothetical protein